MKRRMLDLYNQFRTTVKERSGNLKVNWNNLPKNLDKDQITDKKLLTNIIKIEGDLLENYEYLVREENHTYFEKKARALATGKEKTELDLLLAEMLNREMELGLDIKGLARDDVSPLNKTPMLGTAPTTNLIHNKGTGNSGRPIL
jgi:hypothetical protein